ncbi:hypothetical protein HZQ89_15550 [Elizabethkingia anophelis]|nr:hypothetical protein [Elizabethkingia anophelis]
MKFKIFNIIFFITIVLASGQTKVEDWYEKFILVENIPKSYEVKKYILNTNELYGVDKKIEVYNIFTNTNSIILISTLPSLKGSNNWEKIDINKIKNKILTESEIKKFQAERYQNNSPDSKTLKYGIIKKVNNEYYVPIHCLTEYFTISDYKYPLIPAYGTININTTPVSIKDMEKSYSDQFPDQEFPLDVRKYPGWFDYKTYARNYLSKKIKLGGFDAYQFWTMDGWRVIDGYNVNRGIDRFVYIPTKGIVGGSYDFYFWYLQGANKNNKAIVNMLWDNIINEKIMIAEELK